MEKIKRVFLIIHIVTWVSLSILIYFLFWKENLTLFPNMAIGLLLSALIIFYAHLYFLKPLPTKKNYRYYTIGLGLIILIGPLPFLLFHHRQFRHVEEFFVYYGITAITIVPFFLLMSLITWWIENLLKNTVRKEQLEKQAVQTELHYLKMQIHPHFLFNTLNNIYTLFYIKSSSAPEALLQLSSLMRYLIYESNAAMVSLNSEIQFLEDYISLNQLKYEKNPIVHFKIIGSIEDKFIPPLLFIHFIENAYKHSPEDLSPGAIKMFLEVKENTLIFHLINPCGIKVSQNFDNYSGFGIENIRKRLELLYSENYFLVKEEVDGLYKITLEINNVSRRTS